MAEELKDEEIRSPGSSGKNILVTILLAINLLIMVAVAASQYMIHQKTANQLTIEELAASGLLDQKGQGELEDKQVETGEGVTLPAKLFPLRGFTANLAQGDGPRRYIRLEVVLEFDRDADDEEFKGREAQIRDTIIAILNSKRPEDLLKIEGKAFLKEEIKSAINSFLVQGNVIGIYYVSFQIN
jgi:flagellar FliL protein